MVDRGPFITTFSGNHFYLLDPRPEDIEIRDIAHALSHLCRFTGHSRKLYTVAQHCVIVSTLVPPKLALEGLLHDAAEAYVGDVSTPLKGILSTTYTAIEDAVQEAIAQRFELATPPPPAIKAADTQAFEIEAHNLMLGFEPDARDLEVMSPTVARAAFLDRFEELKR